MTTDLTPIQVAVADDQQLFRQCLVTNINQLPQVHVSMEAENGQQLLLLLRAASVRPDLVLLDLNMPGMNGVETTEQIRAQFPGMKIIILSVHSEPRHVIFMIEKGINGYLSKDSTVDEVGRAVSAVHRTGFYLSEELMKSIQQGIAVKNKKLHFDVLETLSRREREVLELICKEYTTPEIAGRLFLSERTVEGHRTNLLLKTGARNTAGLVIFALRNGVVDVGL